MTPPTKLPDSLIPALRSVEVTPDREPDLQRFFEANPEYFIAVGGGPPGRTKPTRKSTARCRRDGASPRGR
jgi:hypothetical protein